jgi:hypothetical protein
MQVPLINVVRQDVHEMEEELKAKELAERLTRETMLKEAERKLLEQQGQIRDMADIAPAAELLGIRQRNTSPELQELHRQVSLMESEMQVKAMDGMDASWYACVYTHAFA